MDERQDIGKEPRNELKKAKLHDVVPEPVSTTTINSMANPKDRAKETDGASQFKPAARRPNTKEVKKIIAYAVGAGIQVCMDNHFYTINGELRRQLEGGAIGSELTGEVSRNFMLNWDRRFKKKLKDLGISTDIYKRYVDDIFTGLNSINKGWKYNVKDNKMVFNNNDRDNNKTDKVHTAEVLVQCGTTPSYDGIFGNSNGIFTGFFFGKQC